MRIALTSVFVAIGEFGGGNAGKHEPGAETSRQLRKQPCAKIRCEMLAVNTSGSQFVAPQLGMTGLRLRQLQKEISAQWIRFRSSERRIERCSIELVLQIGLIACNVESHRELTRSRLRSTQRID